MLSTLHISACNQNLNRNKFRMGNACCKRRNYELIRDTAETEQTCERRKSNKINNLELYLNDVFEKECLFNAEQEEVEYIKTGIETLVQKIVDLVLRHRSLREYVEIILGTRHVRNSLVELFTPVEPGVLEESINVNTGGQSIIKVGSIYEGTKNNFPDEFDFIFLLFSLREIRHFSSWVILKHVVEKCICSVTAEKKELLFYAPAEILHKEKKLYYDKYMKRHGPAYMLRFVYNNGSGEERYIHVDLVPAYKVTVGINNMDWYAKYISEFVKSKSFQEEAISLRNGVVSVRHDLSLTEIEVHFVRNILSENHREVYRILKFLINGHDDGDTLEQFIDTAEKSDRIGTGYTSYMIKTMMIYHHDECTNKDTTNIGPCVLQVLEKMCNYDNLLHFPRLMKTPLFRSSNLCLLPGLKSLTKCLKSMQMSKDGYDYERVKMKSVAIQYLDNEKLACSIM